MGLQSTVFGPNTVLCNPIRNSTSNGGHSPPMPKANTPASITAISANLQPTINARLLYRSARKPENPEPNTNGIENRKNAIG